MANVISNRLEVKGDEQQIQKMFQFISTGNPDDETYQVIDFTKIIPMPDSLKIEDGSITADAYCYFLELNQGNNQKTNILDSYLSKNYLSRLSVSSRSKAYKAQYSEQELLKLKEMGEIYVSNIKEYGCPTWYEWRCKNWGTKWPAYNDSYSKGNAIYFQTANGNCLRVISKLHEMFNSLTFFYQYADEDIGNNVGEFILPAHTSDIKSLLVEERSSEAYRIYLEASDIGVNGCESIRLNSKGEFELVDEEDESEE